MMMDIISRPVERVQFFDEENGEAVAMRFEFADGTHSLVSMPADGFDVFIRLARESAATLLTRRLQLATSNDTAETPPGGL